MAIPRIWEINLSLYYYYYYLHAIQEFDRDHETGEEDPMNIEGVDEHVIGEAMEIDEGN